MKRNAYMRDLSNQRFGRLVTQSPVGQNVNRNVLWLCHCDCGEDVVVSGSNLVRGSTNSCGCIRRERASALASAKIRHGHASRTRHSPEYSIYYGMIRRCHKESDKFYFNYGGRGIHVCDRWRSGDGNKSGFECFIFDLGPRPSSKYTLEREDNDKGYSPDNCKWATRREQMFNTRKSVKIIYKGLEYNLSEIIENGIVSHTKFNYWLRKGLPHQEVLDKVLKEEIGRQSRYLELKGERKTLQEWSADTGISAPLIHKRIGKMGWSIERSLTTPVQTHKSLHKKKGIKETS